MYKTLLVISLILFFVPFLIPEDVTDNKTNAPIAQEAIVQHDNVKSLYSKTSDQPLRDNPVPTMSNPLPNGNQSCL